MPLISLNNAIKRMLDDQKNVRRNSPIEKINLRIPLLFLTSLYYKYKNFFLLRQTGIFKGHSNSGSLLQLKVELLQSYPDVFS